MENRCLGLTLKIPENREDWSGGKWDEQRNFSVVFPRIEEQVYTMTRPM